MDRGELDWNGFGSEGDSKRSRPKGKGSSMENAPRLTKKMAVEKLNRCSDGKPGRP